MAETGLQKGIKKADPKRYPFLFFYIGYPILLLHQLTTELSACSKAEILRQKNLQYASIPAFFFLSFQL